MKKKIAILYAQIPFMRAGAERMGENLTAQLKRHGFDVELVSMPFKGYPCDSLLDSYLMWRMTDLTEVNGEKIDMVLSLKAPTYMVQHPNKVIWLMNQHRAAYDLKDNKGAFGLDTVAGGADIIPKIRHMDNVAISEAKAVYSISTTVTNRLKTYNDIDSTPLYHPPFLAGRYFAEEYGNYILSVGRLDSNKRVDMLIRALQYCDKHVTAIIAGNGAETENLKKLAYELGVEDRVRFLGCVSDDELLNLYANALGVYFAPADEDYGYITLEAFLSKRPVVTSKDAGAVLEFAKHEENSFVVDFEAEQIGECFNKLYNTKGLASTMGQDGYMTVKDINWDYAIEQLTQTIR